MAKLPTPGGDKGAWGNILNDFLEVSHNANGTLRTSALQSAGGVTEVNGHAPTSGSISVTASDVGALPTSSKLAALADASAASSATDGQVLSYQASGNQWVPATVSSTTVGDATTSSKGILQLSGDLGGTASLPTVPGLANKAASGSNSDITSLSGLTTPLGTGQGGTGNTNGQASVAVAKNGTVAGTEPEINFVEGSGITLTAADNAGANRVDLTVASSIASQPLQAPSYVIHVSSGTAYARNGSTGVDDYSNADSASVLQSAITALGASGGTIVFQAGTYTWNSVPGLPRNTTGWIKIIGEGGVLINLTSSGRRFLDFNRQAAGDTFNFFYIDGFTIDASAINTLTGSQHVVLGTFTLGAGTVTGQDVNFDHLVIRRIRTLNVQTTATATAQQLNVWIVISATNNTTQYTLTNILVEQCEFHGGNYGVAVYGTHQLGFSGDPNVWLDNIVVRDIWHDTGVNPTTSDSFANVHLGSRAQGGTCWISNITGKNSWDVGVEIDNFEQAFVNNVYLENWFGFGVAVTNYNAPTNVNSQTYYLSGIAGHRTAGGWSSNASSLIGMTQSTNSGGTLQPFGRVIATNVKYYRNGSNLDSAGITGDLARLSLPMIEFTLSDGQYYAESLTHTSTSNSMTPTVIYTTQTSRTRVTLRDIDIRMTGTFAAGSSIISVWPLYLSGYTDLLAENIAVNLNLTNITAFSERVLAVGQDTGSIVSGTVRNLRATTNDTGARGIVVQASTKLTISDQLRIEDCDFSGMTGGTEILYVDTTNQAKTWVYGIKWRTFPKPPYAVSTPTSATGTRYIDTWPGVMLIEGGTVSLVELSRDNVTYYQVATSSGVGIPILHTDYYRITYSVAPTITLLPQI